MLLPLLMTAFAQGTPEHPLLASAPEAWTTVGQAAPLIELPLIDGSGTFELASLRGKKVLLIQFASW